MRALKGAGLAQYRFFDDVRLASFPHPAVFSLSLFLSFSLFPGICLSFLSPATCLSFCKELDEFLFL